MTTAMATPPKAEMPPALLAELSAWAQQYAHDAGAGLRDALATADSEKLALQADLDQAQAARDHAQSMAAERDEEIQRLTAELRNARQIATDALVGKAKDQLAIEGKDAQLADLRAQIERNVTAAATLSDARLAAEMELVGAATARDSLAAELRDVRAQLDVLRNRR